MQDHCCRLMATLSYQQRSVSSLEPTSSRRSIFKMYFLGCVQRGILLKAGREMKKLPVPLACVFILLASFHELLPKSTLVGFKGTTSRSWRAALCKVTIEHCSSRCVKYQLVASIITFCHISTLSKAQELISIKVK